MSRRLLTFAANLALVAAQLTPRPIFVTLTESVSNNLPAPTTDTVSETTSAGQRENPSSAVESAVTTSISLPAGAPRPSFITITESLSNNLPTATSDASSVETTASEAESTQPASETSTAEATTSSSLPAGAPRPTFVTLSETSDKIPCATPTTESPASISETAAPAITSSARSGFRTRTRTRQHTRNHHHHKPHRPHHTRVPDAAGSRGSRGSWGSRGRHQ